jgi:hydroxypyruvate isomerase
VNTRFSAHISWLFDEYPYLDRVAAARRAGFRLIETAWPAAAADRDQLPGAVAAQGVGVALLNCPAGDTERGERGFLNDASRREEAEQAFLEAAELAARLGVQNLNVLVGRALPGSVSAQRRSVIEALRAIAPLAGARGLRLLLEPLNATENPGYLAPTAADAVELIERCGSDAVGLLLDVYHVGCAGGDPLAAVDSYADLIGHVQIADWPRRTTPGTGGLDLEAVLARLAERGYTGAVGLEYRPAGRTVESLAFLGDLAAP